MSITTAKASQAAAKAKAARLCGTSNSATPLYPKGTGGSDKVGMAPISTRQFAKGGKVVGGKVKGAAVAARADRPARKSGGRIQDKFANIDMKEANKDRKGGDEHVGGYKKGGKVAPKSVVAKKALLSSAAPAKAPAKAVAKSPLPKAPKIDEVSMKKTVAAPPPKARDVAKPTTVASDSSAMSEEAPDDEEMEDTAVLKRGGRAKRKSGGRTKGKTNINIVIASPQGADASAQGAMPPAAAPPRMAPAPAMGAPGMAGPGAMPPGMPPMPPAGAMPPMPPPGAGGPPPMRKAGGRVYAKMQGGGGSGLGRLKKAGIGSISN